MTRPTRIQKAFWEWKLTPPVPGTPRRSILFYYDTTELFDVIVSIADEMVSIAWHNEEAVADDVFTEWVEIVTNVVRVNL